jgi:hypothetical protein
MLNEKNKESICVQAKASLELGNHYDPKWWVEEVIGSPIWQAFPGAAEHLENFKANRDEAERVFACAMGYA